MAAATQFVGVDIGGSFHEAFVNDQEKGTTSRRRIDNTPQDRKRFIRRLDVTRCRVVMEATGIYYLDLALELAEAGIAVMVVNPKRIYHYAKAWAKRSSTDAINAELMSDFAERMPFRAWTPPPAAWYELRSITRQLNRLSGEHTRTRNRLHALEATERGSRFLIQDEKQGLKALEKRLDRIAKEAQRLIDQDPKLKRIQDHIVAATGFAQRSAMALMGELILLPRTLNSKQCSCHAGLDVRLRTSGTSVEAKPRLSKSGNAFLRAALYLPVLTAVRHDPIAREHYQRLQRRGKPKIRALGAMMRKYLTGIWAVIKTDQPFDSEKLFECRPKEA